MAHPDRHVTRPRLTRLVALVVLAMIAATSGPAAAWATAPKDDQASNEKAAGDDADRKPREAKRAKGGKERSEDECDDGSQPGKKKKGDGGAAKAAPACDPPPPQVPLSNVPSPAPAATDVELQEALSEAGFVDTWYSLTTAHPRLSLIRVTGAEADQARSTLVDELRLLTRTRDHIDALLLAIADAEDQLAATEADMLALERVLADLASAHERATAHLADLEGQLDTVIRGLQGTAVGLYVSEDQLAMTGMDNVSHYNTQQATAMQVEATIDELLWRKQRLESRIAATQARISRLAIEITERRAEHDVLSGVAESLRATIEKLSDEVATLTELRIGLETGLPVTIADAQAARMRSTEPTIAVALVTLDAYVRAAEDVREYHPACQIRWELIAGIAKIESGHATFGGATVDENGTVSKRILGPLLDGSLENTAVIEDTDGGALDGNSEYDAAVGPFQFIPGTWKAHALDSNGDGFADPHNVYDGALSAAGYLCTSSNVADDAGVERSVLSYNHSRKYLADVTAVARDYIVSLSLPDAAFDPETIEASDGWSIDLADPYEPIGQIGVASP